MSFNEFLTLIKANFNIVLMIFLALVILIITLVQKRPNKFIDTVTEKIATLLPQFIRIAEDKFGAGKGEQKLAYVIALVQEWFNGEKLEFTDYYLKLTKLFIEQILNTPEKK